MWSKKKLLFLPSLLLLGVLSLFGAHFWFSSVGMRMQMSHYVNAGNNNQFSRPLKPLKAKPKWAMECE